MTQVDGYGWLRIFIALLVQLVCAEMSKVVVRWYMKKQEKKKIESIASGDVLGEQPVVMGNVGSGFFASMKRETV